MCSTLDPKFCSDKSSVDHIGKVHFRKQRLLGNFAGTERLLIFSEDAISVFQDESWAKFP